MVSRLHMLALLSLFCLGLAPCNATRTSASSSTTVDQASPFGIVATLANRVRDDEQDAAVALLREAGVQWVREEIFWHHLQPQRGGPYRWNGDDRGMFNYDAAITRLHAAGLNVLGQLDYNPAWAKRSNTPLDAWITDWEAFVYTTVARYGRARGQIKYWEIWNEPNLQKYSVGAGLRSISDIVRLLTVARRAVKAADPDAMIVLGGVASIWNKSPTRQEYNVGPFLRLLHAAGGWNTFDILALHPYRPSAPEAIVWRRQKVQTLDAELRAVGTLLATLGPKPVWLTEVAWSSAESYYGVSETEQAAFLVRMYLVALAHPFVERVFWYDLRDDTAPAAVYERPLYDRTEQEYHFGLLRRAYPLDPERGDLRKPAFVAYRTMTELLAGTIVDGLIGAGDPALPGLFGYRLRGGGRTVFVLWRTTSDAPSLITLACGCREAQIRQWDGTLLGVVQTTDNVTVRLAPLGLPLYVVWGQDRGTEGQLFPETGHRVAGAFLHYWSTQGGLAQFGLPISELIVEPAAGSGKPRLVQYFERARMEAGLGQVDPAAGVELGRLGDARLRQLGIDWRTLPRAPEAPAACLAFPETGHQICPPFRAYWELHGGVRQFGMPLSDLVMDEEGRPVQYFERTRFEQHIDQAGTPNGIQLGLLGRELYSSWKVWP